MRQSHLFTKTTKESPREEVSLNAQLLERGGFVQKTMAGVYSYLPLGVRVLQKIETIVREEMVMITGQELFLPALHPKEQWMQTGRWDSLDVLFKITSRHDYEYALGPTHEEIIVPLVRRYVQSYKDLPFAAFQIQTKFRDEARAKSGLLRGREFRMKDLYSFHASEEDLDRYYIRVTDAYRTIFARLGLKAILTEASGGTFSKYSHEFQVENQNGEDTIYYCSSCDYAVNREISETGTCTRCLTKGIELKASEVGNIFKLNTKYSEPFDLAVMDEQGNKKTVLMGCYGIGTSRLLGTIVEVSHDEKGIIWPQSVAPFLVALIALDGGLDTTDALYSELIEAGIDVLYDDRDKGAGEKFADADLIGLPIRVVVSKKTLVQNSCEVKLRTNNESSLIPLSSLLDHLRSLIRSSSQ